MIYLNGKCYVDVKDKRYKIHPLYNMILRELDPPNFLRTQCHYHSNINYYFDIMRSILYTLNDISEW